jgi:DUF971 family protein
MKPILTEVKRLPDERRVRLFWSDGHSAAYDYDYLRGYCPCAACQGHGAFSIVFQKPNRPVEPTSIQPVGNYGISFLWSDGHATGIYRYDFLRAICPCDECAGKRQAAGLEEGGPVDLG